MLNGLFWDENITSFLFYLLVINPTQVTRKWRGAHEICTLSQLMRGVHEDVRGSSIAQYQRKSPIYN